ncbi:MAG: DNA-directed RNA polymerase subunit N [Thermoplasmata archaeon]
MIVPVRCFSCGKVIGSLYETFRMKVKQGQSPKEVLDELGLDRYCCRSIMISHVDLIDEVIHFG